MGLGPLLMTVKTTGVFLGTDVFDSLNLKSVMVTVTLTGDAILLAAPTPPATTRALERQATATAVNLLGRK